MSSFPILDLVAGIIFIYFLLSIINNSLLEIVYSFTNARATMFREWLQSLFRATINNPSTQEKIPLWQALIDHDSTNGLSGPRKATSYMSSKDFSTSLIDLLTANPRDAKHKEVPLPENQGTAIRQDQQVTMTELPMTLDNIEFALNNNFEILPESLRRIFLFYVSQARNLKLMPGNKLTEVQLFSQQLEGWFDRMMERLTGRFKKFSLWYTLCAATLLTLCLNIDSIDLMHYLYDHPSEAVVLANAETAAAYDSVTTRMMNAIDLQQMQLNAYPADSAILKKYQHSMDAIITNAQKDIARKKCATDSLSTHIPIGWNADDVNAFIKKNNHEAGIASYMAWVRYHFFGYLLTILAVCLGAPFWFDVLGKVANLRSSLKPLTTAEEDEKISKN